MKERKERWSMKKRGKDAARRREVKHEGKKEKRPGSGSNVTSTYQFAVCIFQ
jgi:hypothetical protein